MGKRTDIKSILVIGAGPIVIGQACEFDYSGAQAIKALKEEGYRIILVNSNPATIMTDPELADATYIEPINAEFVTKVIEKERPDAILPTMGGQTALNTALELEKTGILKRYHVEMIGANAEAINKAENREYFRTAMQKIGLKTPKSAIIKTEEEAKQAIEQIGFPIIIRPSFTLGGTGGGIAYNLEEFKKIVKRGLYESPNHEILIEQSVIGWKEYEMEVVRDKADNCIIVCSIENIDPMGVHTGDSITTAPALTLTDKEYQKLRNASIAVLREIGVETGGSNVQFAINPKTGEMIVIEMNPRVSRSSALASKATGFPIAKIAAKLAVGYTLDELKNDITKGSMPASFEPVIDYVVTKIPRFAFEKYPGSDQTLTTSMKSVGEVMAIGRCFQESLQKALISLEQGLTGLDEIEIDGLNMDLSLSLLETSQYSLTESDPVSIQEEKKKALQAKLSVPTPDRLRLIAQAFRYQFSLRNIQDICHYDPWFLDQIKELVELEEHVKKQGLSEKTDPFFWFTLKSKGFSDKRLAHLVNTTDDRIRTLRTQKKITPVYKRIDSCAAEFKASTPYLYSSYEYYSSDQNAECESNPTSRKKVIILGSGPNRIGQGIEFDYCCCHAAFALKEINIESIMINCNPETVSTDYDTSDRLYFEPLDFEHVLSVIETEQKTGDLLGVIVQYGGQTPLKLTHQLEAASIPVLGTSTDSIDLAEDRKRFKKLLESLALKQPKNETALSEEEAMKIAKQVGYPIVLRPSYVLGGQGMEIIDHPKALQEYVRNAITLSNGAPVLIDEYIQDAIEVDVDAISDGKTVFIAGIMEHIEQAGIHSGDSACSLPPFSLSDQILNLIREYTEKLANALNVKGLLNVQFAIKDHTVYVLEVNPRASRTVPFIAKTTGVPIAKLAAMVMAGKPLSDFALKPSNINHIAIKEAVFPWTRFPKVDTVLGPEMRSTGEVMGIDTKYETAFFKSLLAGGVRLPQTGCVFISVKPEDKKLMVLVTELLLNYGFKIIATHGTASFLQERGLEVEAVNKVYEGRPHIVDLMKNGDVQLVFNTTWGRQALIDSLSIRRTALMMRIPYFTTASGALAATKAICNINTSSLEVKPIQDYILTC